jgi:hypothetical protein
MQMPSFKAAFVFLAGRGVDPRRQVSFKSASPTKALENFCEAEQSLRVGVTLIIVVRLPIYLFLTSNSGNSLCISEYNPCAIYMGTQGPFLTSRASCDFLRKLYALSLEVCANFNHIVL